MSAPTIPGFLNTTCNSLMWPSGGFSLQQLSISPAVALNDVFIVQSETSPGAYPIPCNGDGTLDGEFGGDASRQAVVFYIWRNASNTLDGPSTFYLNEQGPIWSQALFLQNQIIGVNIAPIALSPTYAYSPEGDTLTFALASGSLPPGLVLGSGGTIAGAPMGNISGLTSYAFVINATDSSGTTVPSPQFVITIEPPPAALPQLQSSRVLDVYDYLDGSVLLAWGSVSPYAPRQYNVYVNGVFNQTVFGNQCIVTGLLTGVEANPTPGIPAFTATPNLDLYDFKVVACFPGVEPNQYILTSSGVPIQSDDGTYWLNDNAVPFVNAAPNGEYAASMDSLITPGPTSQAIITPMKRIFPFPNTGY